MPRCPICNTEYAPGTERCTGCGAPIREDLSDPGPEPELLISTDSQFSTQMTEGRLRSAGIPFEIRQHNDKGIQVILGGSVFGADFYVPAGMLEQARREVGLDPVEELPDGEEDAEATPEPDKKPDVKDFAGTTGHFERWSRKYFLRRLTVFLIAALVLAAYFLLNSLLDFARHLLGY